MDDDDAEYMQGSEDEVCILFRSSLRSHNYYYERGRIPLTFSIDRIMALTIPITTMPTSREAQTLRTCTTLQNVRLTPRPSSRAPLSNCSLLLKTAKKEEDPEQALKEFKVIIDQETEKGDW